MELHEWLTETTAAEVMVRDVFTLHSRHSLAQAAELLLHRQLSGAPVVETEGVCLGVLTISDILGAEEKVADERSKVAASTFWQSNLALPARIYEEKLAQVRDKIAPTGDQAVSKFMTSDIVAVDGEETIGTIIRKMVDTHIHRVLVLNKQKVLQGIISTTDIVASAIRTDDARL